MAEIQSENGQSSDLVVFDCDGVLIDSEVISTRATVEALGDLGYRISEAEAARRFVGRSYASIKGDIETDLGRSLPRSFSDELEHRTLSLMKDELQPIPGIASVLSMLNLRRCVASSSSLDWIKQGLTKTGLIHHLAPHLFSASMVENGKPAPDLFLYAAGQMGVSPKRAIVVEDSLPGVRAAVAAGMRVIGFTGGSHINGPDHGEKLRAAGAGEIIDDISDLLGLLENR